MAKSFFGSTATEEQYVANFYHVKKFGEDAFLVTTEHGSWALLSKKEFELLRLGRVQANPALFEELKKQGIILTTENIENVISDYRQKKSFLFRPPSLHIITPTLRCNLKCIYCHSRVCADQEKGYDMDKETAKKTVDFIMQTPLNELKIEFQGGDFLLNFEITEFIIDYALEKAKEKGKKVNFAMVSNLTLMNEKILESLSKRKIMGLATSLDGPKKVHDLNRRHLGGKGSYEDTVYWIKRIKSEWKYKFNLNALCTVTRHSFGHEKEIVDEYISLGFAGVWMRPLNNIGFAADAWQKIGYSPREFFSFWKKSFEYILEKNRAGENLIDYFALIFLKKILQKEDPHMVDIMSPCGAGISQLLYKYNGDIHTCDEGKIFSEFKLGNVRESKYEDIFRNETLIPMIDISSKKNYLCDNCAWDPYCGVCPIYSYAAQGSIVSILPLDDRCKVYGKIIEEIFRKILFSEEDRQVMLGWLESERLFKKEPESA
ncbi:MAG: His-Xaa-Ser system radical SAM maturase HxsB [Candidatus Diapherotrites archaeon]